MSLEFEKACELDLEGIVAKHQHAPYDTEKSTWFKIRNPNYSQMVGREELFEREKTQGACSRVAHLRFYEKVIKVKADVATLLIFFASMTLRPVAWRAVKGAVSWRSS